MGTDTDVATWGTWSLARELWRGVFHFVFGFTGWVLVHPLGVSSAIIMTALFAVGGLVIGLDRLRITIAQSDGKRWVIVLLQQINLRFVRQYLVRDAEERRMTTVSTGAIGLLVAWIIAPRWICALVALLFGAVDPLAKLGKPYPIRRFQNGKSLGGMLAGLIAGTVVAVFVAVMNHSYPIFPAFPAWHIAAVYAVGVVSAPIFEFFGGRWDNFWIPVGTAATMFVVDIFLPI